MDPLLIVLFIILFSLSAFFSWTELALMSLASHKIEALFKGGKFWSQALKQIKSNNDRLLITILIWNNLVNVYTAALATQIAIGLWEKSWFAQAEAVWIATWIVTFLLLLFWEIIPKSFATKNAVRIALFVSPIYKFLMFLFYPVIIFIEFIIKIFTSKWVVEQLTNEEIESFIDMWKDSWSLEEDEHQRIKNMLEFSDITVDEIMTPRVKIEAIDSDYTLKEAREFYLEHTHSRIPVYEWTIDKINYFITIRDILNWDKKEHIKDLKLSSVIKVPINQPIDILLETFQKSRKHMAIVIDEYGWVAGLVTLEDILEEIFGEIRDETDKEVEQIKSIWENAFLVESSTLIDDLLKSFNLWFREVWLNKKEFSWENISYVITHKIERFPTNWEIVSFPVRHKWDQNEKISLDLKVLNVLDWKIGQLEIRKVSSFENTI